MSIYCVNILLLYMKKKSKTNPATSRYSKASHVSTAAAGQRPRDRALINIRRISLNFEMSKMLTLYTERLSLIYLPRGTIQERGNICGIIIISKLRVLLTFGNLWRDFERIKSRTWWIEPIILYNNRIGVVVCIA